MLNVIGYSCCCCFSCVYYCLLCTCNKLSVTCTAFLNSHCVTSLYDLKASSSVIHVFDLTWLNKHCLINGKCLLNPVHVCIAYICSNSSEILSLLCRHVVPEMKSGCFVVLSPRKILWHKEQCSIRCEFVKAGLLWEMCVCVNCYTNRLAADFSDALRCGYAEHVKNAGLRSCHFLQHV